VNYEFLTGPFAGAIAPEGRILDVPFNELDEDLQSRIRQFATDRGLTDLEDAKELYETSWQSRETDEPLGLGSISPVSEWVED